MKHLSASLVLLLVLVSGCVDRQRGTEELAKDLLPIPQPNLSTVEESVRSQLQTARGEHDKKVKSAAAPSDLATSYGELGRLYHAYELLSAAEAAYRNARNLQPEEFRWVYYLAILQRSSGHKEEALELLNEAAKLKPEDLPTRVRQGELNLELNRADDARRSLQKALEIEENCALAYYFLGQLELQEGQGNGAAQQLEKALALQPRANKVHYSLAQAYRQLGDQQKAQQHLAAIGKGEVRLADPLMQSLEDLKIGAGAFLRRAARAQIEGYDDVALDWYRKAVEADPQNPEARQGLAGMLAQQGDLETAATEFKAALQLGAKSARVYFNLAAVQERLGTLDLAIENYTAALNLDPKYGDALLGLAGSLAQSGELEAADQRYRELIDLEPATVAGHLGLSRVLAQQGNLDAALKIQDRVLQIDATVSEKARALNLGAAFLAQRKATDQAIERYRQAAALDPSSAQAFFGLANLLGQDGRLREAQKAYAKVLEIQPENRQARLGEVTALVLLGDHRQARQRLEKALSADRGDIVLAHTLARLLATSPEASVRDGEHAVQLAEAVFNAEQSLEHAETMAMAFAEAGRFDEAVRLQKRVKEEVEKLGRPKLTQRAGAILRQYERNEPYRQ